MKNEKICIYQVLPRLFGNNTTTNTPQGSLPENGCGKMSAFDAEALAAIKAMGFNHIWYTGLLEHATQTDYSSHGITPHHPSIVKGKAGSPYAISDYYDIDPDLADDVDKRMSEFDELVKRTHQAGLKMIIDFVPNHVAREYRSDNKPEGIGDLGETDNTHTTYDPQNNFYYIPGQRFAPDFESNSDGDNYKEFPAKATGNDCFSAHPGRNDWYETVKLNYGIDYLGGGQKYFDPIPDTWIKMRDILLFWADRQIDGFRCDMAEMVPVEFWGWVIPIVKERYPSILFIAEVYNPEQYRNYLYNGKFDYLYDKVGLYDTLREVIIGWKPAHAITQCWQAVDDIQGQMLNFLENHDEQRIASEFFANDPRRALPALVVSATMNKNPFMLYFGQELGEPGMDAEGFSGRDGRTTIFDYWNIPSIYRWRQGNYSDEKLSEAEKELRTFYVRLLQLCNKQKAIREGLFYDLMYVNFGRYGFNPEKQYAYLRYHENELLLVVANFDEHDTDAQVFIPSEALDYLGIDPSTLKPDKELLSGVKVQASIRANEPYLLSVKGHNAAIIRFTIKK